MVSFQVPVLAHSSPSKPPLPGSDTAAAAPIEDLREHVSENRPNTDAFYLASVGGRPRSPVTSPPLTRRRKTPNAITGSSDDSPAGSMRGTSRVYQRSMLQPTVGLPCATLLRPPRVNIRAVRLTRVSTILGRATAVPPALPPTTLLNVAGGSCRRGRMFAPCLLECPGTAR